MSLFGNKNSEGQDNGPDQDQAQSQDNGPDQGQSQSQAHGQSQIDALAKHYLEALNKEKQSQFGPWGRDGEGNPVLLFPTVIIEQDSERPGGHGLTGKVLGLTYSSEKSLVEAIRQRRGIYWSRSRSGLWIKSESTGKNRQELLDIKFNCDATGLIFIVRQHGVFCHEGVKSCFQSSINQQLPMLRSASVEARSPIRIVYPLGRSQGDAMTLLTRLGITVAESPKTRSLNKKVITHYNGQGETFQLFGARPGDIQRLLQEDHADIAVNYDNCMSSTTSVGILRLEYSEPRIHPVRVALVGRETSSDGEESEGERSGGERSGGKRSGGKRSRGEPSRGTSLFTEFPEITERWLATARVSVMYPPNNLDVVPITGNAEEFLISGLADLIITVVDTGRTLRENKLEIIEVICESDIAIYTHARFNTKRPDLIRSFRKDLTETIYFFDPDDKDWGIFSNHYLASFNDTVEVESTGSGTGCDVPCSEWKTICFPTVQHYYQAAKFWHDPALRREIMSLKEPKQVWNFSRKHRANIRSDWSDELRFRVMRDGLRLKFTDNKQLGRRLVATGKRVLVKHDLKDPFWGIGPDGKGENHLGKLLMKIREELYYLKHT